ncbi:MAG: DUF998 domain-containing protein [Bacteroidales bacterium]|nr:DUF998 domain-containing protein [Bacteroidales bacterium]
MKIFTKNSLLICGIISTILYVIATILGALKWPEYDSFAQSVSELIAVNAPSAPLVIPLFLIYSLLVFAFGIGVWLSADNKKSLRIVAVLIIAKEVFGVIATLFAPMHLRGVETSSSDTWHIILTAVGVLLCMFPAIIFSARAFGKGFLIFSIASIIVFLVFGALAGMDGAKIAENLPTPYTGIRERINIFMYFIWVNVLAITLLRQNNFNGLNRK